MAIFRGLNIAKGMIDVDDPRIALRNLGLNRADLDLIRGLTQPGTDVTVTDFHAVSKLIEPQKTTLQSLASTAETTNDVLESVSDIRVPMDFNMSINSRIAGSAIKFNYIDFSEVDGLNYWSLRHQIYLHQDSPHGHQLATSQLQAITFFTAVKLKL